MKFRLRALAKFLDRFIPAQLSAHDPVERLYRARVILIVPFIVGISHVLSCIVIYRSAEQLRGFAWLIWPAAIASLLLLLSVFIFRRTASFVISANVYSLGATMAVVCLVLVTGGHGESPFTILLPLVVLFTFIMARIQIALLWGSIGLLVWCIGANLDNLSYPNLIPEHWRQTVRMAVMLNAGVCMMGVLWFFDLFHRNLLRRLQVERDRALFSAARDPLTGLANRKTFDRRLEQIIEHQRVTGCRHALLLMDLDQFKKINDTHGHASGDALLKSVAAGLRDCVRSSDLAARVGGDEFGLLLYDVGSAENLGPIIQKIHDAVTREVTLADGARLRVGASIGAAVMPDDGEDADQLMESADRTMYRAKDSTQ